MLQQATKWRSGLTTARVTWAGTLSKDAFL